MYLHGLCCKPFSLIPKARMVYNRCVMVSVLILAVLVLVLVNPSTAQTTTFHGRGDHKSDELAGARATMPGNITLDVVVTDRQGRPVRGLTKQDFTVDEDGHGAEITSFRALGTSSDHDQQRSSGPRLVLVLDNITIAYGDAARVRAAMSKYFKRENGKLNQPVMLLAVTRNGLVVLHDFTQGGYALDAALKHLDAHLNLRYYKVFDRNGQVGEYHGDYSALWQIAESLNQIPGHKTIVWITSGAPWNSSGNCYEKLPDILISNLLFESRSTLYTVFPKSVLQFQGPFGAFDISDFENTFKSQLKQVSEAGSVAGGSGLGRLAFETGGTNLFGGSVDNELDSILAAASAYYTITYKSSLGIRPIGGFRRINVEVTRPGLVVDARKGYYGVFSASTSPTVSTTVAQMKRVLANPLPFAGLSIINADSTVISNAEANNTPVARIQLALDSEQLTWESLGDGSRRCTLDIASAEIPKKGALEAYSVKQTVISMHVSKGTPANGVVTASVLQPLISPTGYLRVVVRDDRTGRIGTAEIHTLP